MANKLKYLVIHSTDTPKGRAVSRADIEQWHLVERGWSKVGYADLIHLDGTVENLTPYNEDNQVDPWEITNGARGYNSKSRHVCYVGGGNEIDTRTFEQVIALEAYVRETIALHPSIKIIGHNQISTKKCPSFDVSNWLKTICIEERFIGL
tara:strand:+ start:1600 stop:2052 length:453 start_codon:yes stop_codon:yes gene_type:complete